MSAGKILTSIAAVAVLMGPGMVAVAGSASAETCGFDTAGGHAYWDNCDNIGHKVRVDVSFVGYNDICVGAFQRRDLGFAGTDEGFVRGATQIGSCPS